MNEWIRFNGTSARHIKEFSQFDPSNSEHRLDMLLKKHIDTVKLSDLWCVVRSLLLLTHGQASIERGFSVNKQMQTDNLCERTFVAQRMVHDHIISVGGIMLVEITKGLMTSCQSAWGRYQAYLEQKWQLPDAESVKRKRLVSSDRNGWLQSQTTASGGWH